MISKKKHTLEGGVIELIGSGIDFRTGDLALRGNFATIDGSNRIVDRRAGRNISEEELKSICESLSSRVDSMIRMCLLLLSRL